MFGYVERTNRVFFSSENVIKFSTADDDFYLATVGNPCLCLSNWFLISFEKCVVLSVNTYLPRKKMYWSPCKQPKRFPAHLHVEFPGFSFRMLYFWKKLLWKRYAICDIIHGRIHDFYGNFIREKCKRNEGHNGIHKWDQATLHFPSWFNLGTQKMVLYH